MAVIQFHRFRDIFCAYIHPLQIVLHIGRSQGMECLNEAASSADSPEVSILQDAKVVRDFLDYLYRKLIHYGLRC